MTADALDLSAASPTADAALVARWREEPAPLLPVLHAFNRRDGYLSDAAMQAVSAGLGIPLAELYGTITFYHFFKREAPGRRVPRVCDGPICRRHGSQQLLEKLEGAEPMPCAGRCDQPIPVIFGGNRQLVGHADGTIESDQPTPVPAELPAAARPGYSECVFAFIREPRRQTLDGYRRTGGYAALQEALRGKPGTVLENIEHSALAGRGGAGFPTGMKWKMVAEAEGAQKWVICNADEGEPGCFKDRALMDHDPHALVEGMALAAFATGASGGIIYLRYEYPHTEHILERALQEARDANLLGDNILGSGLDFDICIRRGAGAYICGEETSLLESLEGRRPWPRNKPPFPVTHGFMGQPTVINNVETLCSVPPIVRHDPEWYRDLGLDHHVGTKVISVSGDVRKPGNFEVPFGLPLRELLHDWCGGPKDGRKIIAVTQAGLSGGFLAGEDLEDATLDEHSMRSKGSFLGAAGILVFDDSRDIGEVTAEGIEFFQHESCGKCFPCRIGTTRLVERLTTQAGPKDFDAWSEEVADICTTMKSTSACGLGVAAPLIVESALRYFPERFRERVTRGAEDTDR